MKRVVLGVRGFFTDLLSVRLQAVDAASQTTRAAITLAPVIWLIGKVQSGKSSIVRVITDSTEVQIGTGFKPCTRTAAVFEFPAEMPILRFLDTRGLGEVSYDPAADMAFAEQQAHLLLVTMRALDVRQQAVIDAVVAVRRRHPDWPIVVAQTCLHEGYPPGMGHHFPYAFGGDGPEMACASDAPQDLLRSLAFQRSLFDGVPGSGPVIFVPIDFTRDGDGFDPQDYGRDALTEALVRVAPEAMTLALSAIAAPARDHLERRSQSVVLGHAMAAAGGDLIPIAGAVAVTAVQTRLLQQLGKIYGVTWDRRTMIEFATALGGGVIARTFTGLGLRQLTKLIPVYGQTIGAAASAAMSFAVTFALGKAAIYFLGRRRAGHEGDDGVAAVYQQALRQALQRSQLNKPGRTRTQPSP